MGDNFGGFLGAALLDHLVVVDTGIGDGALPEPRDRLFLSRLADAGVDLPTWRWTS